MPEQTLIGLKPLEQYRSESNDVVAEFYVPCLERSVRYSRAVGYFTSASLELAAQGVLGLCRNNGTMRLIASPQLTEEDSNAIARGLKSREQAETEACDRALREGTMFNERAMALLEWLVARRRLEIKIASRDRAGIYHEKIGIFEDEKNNLVSFTGSSNETAGGLTNNFESLNVFCSWDVSVSSRAKQKLIDFEALWANETPGLRVVDYTEAAKDGLLRFRNPEVDRQINSQKSSHFSSASSKKIERPELRKYQQDALYEWAKSKYRGVFEMATGSGKTITALAGATTLAEKLKSSSIILVVVPYKHLVLQWQQEAQKFGLNPHLAFENSKRWHPPLSSKVIALNSIFSAEKETISVITTNKTLASQKLKTLISSYTGNLILIGDEAHNLGSGTSYDSLPKNAKYRIGLSATPRRHLDDEGTRRIFSYFGETVFTFSLKNALDAGFLCKYDYHVVPVRLTEQENDEFEDISSRINRLIPRQGRSEGDELNSNEQLKSLLIARARLLNNAENKIHEFKKLLEHTSIDRKTIVYVSEGDNDESPRESISVKEKPNTSNILKILGAKSVKARKFTNKEKNKERTEIVEQLLNNKLDALVAIRCLDEGFDLPGIEKAFILASTTNPKQFIQRRGRVLRKALGKAKAEIYDFVVLPSRNTNRPGQKSIFAKEWARVREFAVLADNGPSELSRIHKIATDNGIPLELMT